MSSLDPEQLPDPHDQTLVCDLLTERVEALINAWEAVGDAAAPPPSIADHLPAGPPLLRRLALIELIKVDVEYRCQRPEHAWRVEQYRDQFPELATPAGDIPCELIYEEFHVRKQSGQEVTAQEYFERFPRQAAELARLLGLESPHLSTAIRGSARFEEIEVGDKLEDFDLLTRLGRGAFATVFLARQLSMQRIVALKVSADRGNEPQTMARLDHPHIVRVYDQRRIPDRRLRLLYMQYISGGTLQSVVDTIRNIPPTARSGQHLLEAIDRALVDHGESPPTDSHLRQRLAAASWPHVVCWLGSRLASALDYAHVRGVLHRDVKPANVLVSADGTPKLADFNISYSSKVEGASAAAYFGGSLAYMAPEQLEACNPAHEREAADLDGRSDVYSLGVVLWELLTGSRPFADCEPNSDWSGTLDTMIAERQQGVPQVAIDRLPRNCPNGLKQILLSSLAPEREQRFATAGQFSRQLELSLAPQVMRLLRPRQGSVRNWVRRFPLIAMFAAGLIPNLIFSALNLAYNIPAIFETLGISMDEVLGDPVVSAVNALAFTIGIGVLLPFAWPVVRAVTRVHRGCPQPIDRSPRWRVRALQLPDMTAAVSGFEWIATGLVWPVYLNRVVPPDHFQPVAVYVHFMASQLLCGLMAASLAYGLVGYLAVRAYYPTLFQADVEDPGAVERVQALERRTWVYFALAVLVPPLALVVMVAAQSMSHSGMSQATFAVFGAVGLLNSGLVFVLLRAVQKAVAALSIAVSPPGTIAMNSAESLSDSFWR